jgi:hypothetical protein
MSYGSMKMNDGGFYDRVRFQDGSYTLIYGVILVLDEA